MADVTFYQTMLNISLQMAQTRDLQPLLEYAMRTVMDLVHAEYGYLALMDETGQVDCRVSLNADGQTITGPERNISLSILKRVIEQKKPLLMQDAVNGIRTTTGLQLRSVICAPLTTPRATIGALYLENRSRLAIFQQQDLEPLELFAAQAAVFIENSLLYGSLEKKVRERTLALERRANEMETINGIGLAILSDLKLAEVLRAVFQQCKRVAPVDAFYIALYHPNTEDIVFPLFLDDDQPVPTDGVKVTDAGSVTAHIVRSRETVYIPDDPPEGPPPDVTVPPLFHVGGKRVRAYLGVPMVVRDQILGVISIQSYQPNIYTDEHIRLLQTISVQAAIAVEHARLFDAARQAREETEAANRRLQSALQQMETLASTDKLTGAFNRRKFDEIIGPELQRAQRYQTPLALIIFDADHYKQFNDRYGHHMGDAVLGKLAQIVMSVIRASDMLIRWGGDEFIILSPGIGLEQGGELADRLRQAISRHHFPISEAVTISLGVTAYRPGDTPDALVRRADDALYRAKAQGRNCVVLGD
ncbi:MAG TPA: diguanylate cyclase [Anaerolineaceae bacterium]|jgi:diguanylate cyclase (GGDEF)-like protein|nr:diguanylate cyclase [Anaerolineaceae bacterium]